MEFGVVSVAAIIGMVITMIVSIGFPVFLLIMCLKKAKAKFSSFLIGAGTFVVMVLILESIMHNLVLRGENNPILANKWLYALYGGLAAAAFEEIGRFFAMKLFIKKENKTLQNAITYGVGHGGIEAILLVGLSYISNIATSIMINGGAMEATMGSIPEEMKATVFNQLSALWTTPAYLFYVAGFERVLAVVLQIMLSIIIFQGVKHHKLRYFLVAFFAHFQVDFGTVMLGGSPIVAEIYILVSVIIWTVVAFGITGKEKI